MTLHDSPPSRSDPETLRPSSLEQPVRVDRTRHRLYIDESGDHTFHLADNDNHRHLGLLGIWFDTGLPYKAFAQALNDLKADIFGWHPDDPPICPLRREVVAERRGESPPADFSSALLEAARPKMNCHVSTGRILGYGKVWLD